MTIQHDLKPADAVSGEKGKAMYALWLELKGERMAPRRKEVTLDRVRALTPWIWTIEVIAGGADFRFRMAGDRVFQFLENNYQNRLLSELPESSFFDRMKQVFSVCVAHKRPLAIGPIRSTYENKEHWEFEALVLPLSEDGKNVTSLMGTMEMWPAGTMTGAG